MFTIVRNTHADRILPMLPDEESLGRLVYFAPARPGNTIRFNPLQLEPGQDATRVAEDIFTSMKRALGDEDLGPRMKPILQNALAAVMAREGITFWDVKRFLEDPTFRDDTVELCSDEYITDFWLNTFPNYPKGSVVPVVNRLDQFLRPPVMRSAFCHPHSSFSVASILNEGKIFCLDMSGLSEESRMVVGQLILSKFQLELMGRERSGREYQNVYLYADEFQSFAQTGLSTWRQLLSRGRKYGLCLTLANQFPSQLPTELLNDILGNVSSLVALSLRSKDAAVINKELRAQADNPQEEPDEAVAVETFLQLPKGRAIAKFDRSPAFAFQVTQNELDETDIGHRIIDALYAVEVDKPKESTPKKPEKKTPHF